MSAQGIGENHAPTELPHIGLDCWSPNVAINRDPRWGRNMEVPSEDPLLNGPSKSNCVLVSAAPALNAIGECLVTLSQR